MHRLTRPPLLDKDNKRYGTLLHFKVPKLKILLSDNTLFKMGISQVRPRGGRVPIAHSSSPLITFGLIFTGSLHLSSMDPSNIQELKKAAAKARIVKNTSEALKKKKICFVSQQHSQSEATTEVEGMILAVP